jgi:glucoamylase
MEGLPDKLRGQILVSAMTLRCHLDKTYPGAMVASLSVPWGNTRNERGGYHLAWPRDLVECALAFLALGTAEEACDTLRYLIATQQEDGHWLQNQWLGGTPYWNGVQLDETAFPVVLAAAVDAAGGVDGIALADMARRALGFVVRRGPASDQDRWEENAGITTFTLAVCIAALVAGAKFLPCRARWLALAVADFWNARIEEWTVARNSAVGRANGVAAHFVRLAPDGVLTDPGAMATPLPIRNRADGAAPPAAEQVSADFLQLVRFGLRAADDPVVRDTLILVDRLLRYDGPTGPAFRRYDGDGYGEHSDGAPYDGTGQGRPWPLLSGERGHYELAAGRDPLPYLQAMDAMTGPGGMIPEQIWDAAPVPALYLQPGKPAGSAMPLAWAHAEFLKLAVSRQAGRIADRPEALERRYDGKRPRETRTVWTPAAPVTRLAPGANLVLAFPWPVRLRCRVGDRAETEAEGRPNPLGLWTHIVPARTAPEGADVRIAWARMDGVEAQGEARLTVREARCGQTLSARE